MLARLAARSVLSLTAAVLLASVAQVPTLATGGGGGPGSGGSFGGVQCGQSDAPGCVITAGSPSKPNQSQPGGVTPPGSGTAGTGGASLRCYRTLCAAILGTGGGAALAPLPPGTLAVLVREYLILPSPAIESSPAPGSLQLTQLPTWLWISHAAWVPRSKTAAAPGETVTATATPVLVSWHPGDGSTVTCDGPGIPYTSAYSPSSPSPDCGYTYTQSSASQPGGAYHVTATITWDITWTGTGGAGGALPPLFTTAVMAFRVAESQALNVSGGP
jgi:hypothetical protein